MTPQATLLPALPVVRLSSVPPLPRSSVPLRTTIARPMMLCGPCSEISLSQMLMLATPLVPASMLPRSPTWRSVSLGAPWCFCKETRQGYFLQVKTEVPEQGHMSVTLQSVWVIKRSRYCPSYNASSCSCPCTDVNRTHLRPHCSEEQCVCE